MDLWDWIKYTVPSEACEVVTLGSKRSPRKLSERESGEESSSYKRAGTDILWLSQQNNKSWKYIEQSLKNVETKRSLLKNSPASQVEVKCKCMLKIFIDLKNHKNVLHLPHFSGSYWKTAPPHTHTPPMREWIQKEKRKERDVVPGKFWPGDKGEAGNRKTELQTKQMYF